MKKNIFIGILLLSVLIISACTNGVNTASSGVQQASTPQLKSSVEQDNIKQRLQIMNTPTTTLWFYGLSDTGSIIFKSAVQGKVTSSGKRLEPIATDSTSCGSYVNIDSGGSSIQKCSNEIIQADGTFGHSDEYVYWFDFENNYFQWNGKYILTTKPLKINSPIIEFQQVSQ